VSAGPPPHEGPCKRCGYDLNITKLGRYRGLCDSCRPLVAAEQKQARAAAAQPARERAPARPTLTGAINELLPVAERLESALVLRSFAHREAESAVAAFKQGFDAIARIAQSLVNTSKPEQR
jgi:hypothetical protein